MSVITPNMSLVESAIGIDTGLAWEQNLNTSLSIIDVHNHAAGSGVQITPAGLNINTNLSFQGNQLTSVYGILFSAPATNSQNTFLYTAPQSGGGVFDLFYNDGAGNVIPITKAGIVNAVASSIPGESYSGGTFTWKQGSGSTTPANFDIGSITLRPNTSGTTNGIELTVPSGIASAYSLILPAIPSATSFMQVDTSGNITASVAVSGGITGSNIASQTITASNIADNTITNAQLAAATPVSSSSSGNFNTSSGSPQEFVSESITTIGGGAVQIILQSSAGLSSNVGASATGTTEFTVYLYRNNTLISENQISGYNGLFIAPGMFNFLDLGVVGSSGSYTYKYSISLQSGTLAYVNNCVLVAYELP